MILESNSVVHSKQLDFGLIADLWLRIATRCVLVQQHQEPGKKIGGPKAACSWENPLVI